MRKWSTPILLLALTALPSAAYAQYPYPPAGYYQAPYPYYQPHPYAAPAYYAPPMYYPPTAPMNAPTPPVMPAFSARATDWEPTLAQVQAYAQPASLPLLGTVKSSPVGAVKASAVGEVGARPVTKTALPATDDSLTPTAAPKKDPVGEPNRDTTVVPTKKDLVGELKDTAAAPTKEPKTVPFPTTQTVQPEAATPAPVAIAETDGRSKRFVVFGDYLLWNVHGADVPYAQPFDGIIPVLSVPRGSVGVVSPQFQSGFRAGGGGELGCGVSIFATFTYFFTERSNEIAASDGLVLHNFLAFPNTANSAVDSLSASANYKIRLYMGDIDAKCAIVDNDCFKLNWLAGLRYAHNDQNVFSTFLVTGATTVDSKINFDGFGPRFGLEGQYRLNCGLFGYCSGIVDVLFGQFRGSYEENNVFTGLVGLTSITANRVVPVLELELGAGWQSSDGRIRVSGGYYVGSWFNMMTTTSFASAIGNTNFTTNGNNFRDNIVFDGLVARFEFRY